MVIRDEDLPHIVVTLFDIARILHECSDEGGTTPDGPGLGVIRWIDEWEGELLTRLGSSVTREELYSRCHQAPPHNLLAALITQQEALQTLAENERYAELGGGMPTEEAAFWQEEGGDGYWALEMGKAALRSTWWHYHVCLRAWADAVAGEILEVLEQAEAALRAEAELQSVRGWIEQCLQQVAALRDHLGKTAC